MPHFGMNWRVAVSMRGHVGHNIHLSLPLVFAQLATIGIWTADVIAMGRMDSASLAAGSLASRYYQPFYFMALGVSLAVGPLVAQGIGAGNQRQVRRTFRQGMVIALVFGTAAIPVMFAGENVLVFLGQDPELARLGQPFLLWSAMGLPFMFLAFVLRQYLISHAKVFPQLLALVLALLVNVGLNRVLGAGLGPIPALGLGGIAMATSLVYLLLCIGLMIYIGRSHDLGSSKPFQRLWVMDWEVTRRILRIGIPVGFAIVAETGMFIAIVLFIGVFGTAALAAASIANQIAAVMFMIPIGIAQAGTIHVGLHAGAGHRLDVSASANTALGLTLGATTITMIILFIWPHALVDIFIRAEDASYEQVVAFALPMLFITALFQIPDGIQAAAMAVLRGLNDTRTPGIIAVTCFWVTGVGAGAFAGFVLGLGAVWVWAGLLTGLGAASIILTARVFVAMRRVKDGGIILKA